MMATLIDDDCKHAKADKIGTSRVFSKYSDCLRFLLTGASQSSFTAYAFFLMVVAAVYFYMGGNFADGDEQQGTILTNYITCIAENLGLLILRHKINHYKSVKGISGTTINMYVLTYTIRLFVTPPFCIDHQVFRAFYILSLLMVIDVRRSIFVTYKDSYQKDLDVVKLKYIGPACLALALVLHPDLQKEAQIGMPQESWLFCVGWSVCLYWEALSLTPQVVMMGKSGGKVEALLAHFVAATALSRLVDLSDWFFFSHEQYPLTQFEWGVIVFFHLVHLVLVSDFMYYHIKARLSGSSFFADVSIGEGPIEV